MYSVCLANTRALKEPPCAMTVQPIQDRQSRALHCLIASATRATRARMAARAPHAWRGNSTTKLALLCAHNVQRAKFLRRLQARPLTSAGVASQTPTRTPTLPSALYARQTQCLTHPAQHRRIASATRATRARMVAHARCAWRGNSKAQLTLLHAPRARRAGIRR